MPKFTYTKRKQVKIKPKSKKFSYTKRGQIKFKPKKRHESKLSSLAKSILLEIEVGKMTVVNPQTKNKIKVLSALKYPKEHPAHKAAVLLLKKKKVTIPSGDTLKYKKPGTQGTLFNLEPFEDSSKAYKKKFEGALHDDDADTELRDDYVFLDNLDNRAKESIEKYTGSGHAYMNAYLRGDLDGAYEILQNAGLVDSEEQNEFWQEDADEILSENIEWLDNAFESDDAILKYDVITYRGVESPELLGDFERFGVGTEFSDDGFISTSVDENIARNFHGEYGARLKILATKGTKAIYPDGAGMGYGSTGHREEELILKRGTSFRIVQINKIKVSGFSKDITEIVCETV